jgi:hypothetical protein
VTADATTAAIVRPWFYIPDHAPGGTPAWLAGKVMEEVIVPASTSDVFAPVRRINSVPTGATRMYLQVDSIAGTAPANLYMVVYGLTGIVANVDVGDIQVDIEASGISIGSVKLEDGTTTKKAIINEANTVRAATDDVLVVQPIDASGNILKGGGGVGGGAGIYSVKQLDCTAAYTAATQLTLAGLPLGLTVGSFVQVDVWDATGQKTTYTPDANAFAWVDATGVLTVTGATFAATDVDYDVLLWYVPKGYVPSVDANNQYTINPPQLHYLASNPALAEVTNGVDGSGTTYEYQIDTKSYHQLGLQFVLGAGSGVAGAAIVCTIRASWKPGAVTADCVDVTSMFGVTDINDATAVPVLIDNLGLLSTASLVLVRVVANTGGANDGDWSIFYGQAY